MCLVECRSQIGLNVICANAIKLIKVLNIIRILKMYSLYNPPTTEVYYTVGWTISSYCHEQTEKPYFNDHSYIQVPSWGPRPQLPERAPDLEKKLWTITKFLYII